MEPDEIISAIQTEAGQLCTRYVVLAEVVNKDTGEQELAQFISTGVEPVGHYRNARIFHPIPKSFIARGTKDYDDEDED